MDFCFYSTDSIIELVKLFGFTLFSSNVNKWKRVIIRQCNLIVVSTQWIVFEVSEAIQHCIPFSKCKQASSSASNQFLLFPGELIAATRSTHISVNMEVNLQKMMRDPNTASSRIYIGNIPEGVSQQDIQIKFSKYGLIRGVLLNRKCFAYGILQRLLSCLFQGALDSFSSTMITVRIRLFSTKTEVN